MNDRPGRYDPSVLAALSKVLAITDAPVIRRMRVSELVEGLTLADDVKTMGGTLVCARGQEITRSMRLQLKNYLANIGIQPSVRVFVPLEMAEQFGEQDSVAIGE